MKFIALIIFAVSSLANAADKMAWPSNEDYGAMFNSASTLETFLYLDMIGTEGKSKLEGALNKYGLTKDYKLPKAKMDGKFVVFDGVPKKFDFSKLHDGQISDGRNTMRFDSTASEEKQIDQFVEFVTGKKVAAAKTAAASTCSILLPCANAFDANEVAEKVYGIALAAAGIAVGARGFTQLMKYIKLAPTGGLPIIAPLGRAAVLLLAAESLVKAGIRVGKGDSVECQKDMLVLKTARGAIVPLNNRGEDPFASVLDAFSHAKVGAAELVARRTYCDNKKFAGQLLHILLGMSGFGAKPTEPAGITR
jgi:hypothetical protein